MLTALRGEAARYDMVLLDLGAGLDRAVRRMSAWADTLLVLATEEPTSLTDAYAVLKLYAADRPQGDARVVVNQAATRQAGERTFATLGARLPDLPRPRAPPGRRDPPRRPRARRDPPADAAAVAPSDLARRRRRGGRSPRSL